MSVDLFTYNNYATSPEEVLNNYQKYNLQPLYKSYTYIAFNHLRNQLTRAAKVFNKPLSNNFQQFLNQPDSTGYLSKTQMSWLIDDITTIQNNLPSLKTNQDINDFVNVLNQALNKKCNLLWA